MKLMDQLRQVTTICILSLLGRRCNAAGSNEPPWGTVWNDCSWVNADEQVPLENIIRYIGDEQQWDVFHNLNTLEFSTCTGGNTEYNAIQLKTFLFYSADPTGTEQSLPSNDQDWSEFEYGDGIEYIGQVSEPFLMSNIPFESQLIGLYKFKAKLCYNKDLSGEEFIWNCDPNPITITLQLKDPCISAPFQFAQTPSHVPLPVSLYNENLLRTWQHNTVEDGQDEDDASYYFNVKNDIDYEPCALTEPFMMDGSRRQTNKCPSKRCMDNDDAWDIEYGVDSSEPTGTSNYFDLIVSLAEDQCSDCIGLRMEHSTPIQTYTGTFPIEMTFTLTLRAGKSDAGVFSLLSYYNPENEGLSSPDPFMKLPFQLRIYETYPEYECYYNADQAGLDSSSCDEVWQSSPEVELPEILEQNTAPYFLDFDTDLIIEVYIGDVHEFELPETADDEDDALTLSYDPKALLHSEFDQSTQTITFSPQQGDSSGFYKPILTLQDAFDHNVQYILNVYIREIETTEQNTTQITNSTYVPDVTTEDVPEIETFGNSTNLTEEQESIQNAYTFSSLLSSTIENNQNAHSSRVAESSSQQESWTPAEAMNPNVVVVEYTPFGQLELAFDQLMIMPNIAEYFLITRRESVAEEHDSVYRQLSAYGGQLGIEVDLSPYVDFEIIRGDDDTSAPLEDLGFQVYVEDYETESVFLQFVFQNPLSVSIGSQRDILRLEFIDSRLFASQESGLTLEEGKYFIIELPRQYPDQEEYQSVQIVSEHACQVAESAFWFSLLTAILISISLKTMWSILNVMQVVAYTRLYSNWPANIMTIMDNVQLAITMDIFYDSLINFGKDQYEIAADKILNENLSKNGVSDPNLYKNLSILVFIFVSLVFLLLIYFLCKLIYTKCPKVRVLKDILKKKLFYSAWIRFLIEGNIKLTHNTVVYLVILGSFESASEGVQTLVYILIGLLLVIWPSFIAIFVQRNQSNLEQQQFLDKFDSLYLGNKTNHLTTACYYSVFCIRRLFIVLIYIAFRSQNGGEVAMIYSFLVLQSVYIIYTYVYFPHIENVYNYLELTSEVGLVLLAYQGLIFAMNLEKPTSAWILGYVSIGFTAFIVISNLTAMLIFGIRKLKLILKKRKAKNLAMKSKTDEENSENSLKATLKKRTEEESKNRLEAIKEEIKENIQERQSFEISQEESDSSSVYESDSDSFSNYGQKSQQITVRELGHQQSNVLKSILPLGSNSSYTVTLLDCKTTPQALLDCEKTNRSHPINETLSIMNNLTVIRNQAPYELEETKRNDSISLPVKELLQTQTNRSAKIFKHCNSGQNVSSKRQSLDFPKPMIRTNANIRKSCGSGLAKNFPIMEAIISEHSYRESGSSRGSSYRGMKQLDLDELASSRIIDDIESCHHISGSKSARNMQIQSSEKSSSSHSGEQQYSSHSSIGNVVFESSTISRPAKEMKSQLRIGNIAWQSPEVSDDMQQNSN